MTLQFLCWHLEMIQSKLNFVDQSKFVLPLSFTRLQSAPHPAWHTSASSMWVLTAFIAVSIPPDAPAFTWFLAYYCLLLVYCLFCFTIVLYKAPKHITSPLAYSVIFNMFVNCFYNNVNSFCCCSLHFIIIFVSFCTCFVLTGTIYCCLLSCTRV